MEKVQQQLASTCHSIALVEIYGASSCAFFVGQRYVWGGMVKELGRWQEF